MRFQVSSDIHLEHYKEIPENIILPKTEYLFLAGDIGQIKNPTYKTFIDYISLNWKHTIIILGNHEFYHSRKHYEKLLIEYEEFFMEYENITLLEKDIIELDGYRVLGLTMWAKFNSTTNLNCPNKIKKREVNGKKIRTIPMGYKGINELFKESVEWLKTNYDEDYPTIIITHYPLTTSSEHIRQVKYRDESKESIYEFASDLPIMKGVNELICISGHTHYSHDYIDENNVRYISNQYGYKDEITKYSSVFESETIY